MNFERKDTLKIVYVFLLCLAIYATAHELTNLHWSDLAKKYHEEYKTYVIQGQERNVTYMPVEYWRFIKAKRAPKTEEAPLTPDQVFNWAHYPSTEVVATGYTAGEESTGKDVGDEDYGITYSGVKVKRDLYSTIAADLNIFPVGTILYVPGYGYGVVADKGGAIRGNRLDLYYDTVHEVYKKWGKKKVKVYIVRKGDGTLTESELSNLNNAPSVQVFRKPFYE